MSLATVTISPDQRRANFFRAIGDPQRQRILHALGERPMCVMQLQKELGHRQQAISHHLTILKLRGLVERRRDGKRSVYTLTDQGRKAVEVSLWPGLD
jgi:DNA-binding transcriptional ArsR family regulator